MLIDTILRSIKNHDLFSWDINFSTQDLQMKFGPGTVVKHIWAFNSKIRIVFGVKKIIKGLKPLCVHRNYLLCKHALNILYKYHHNI